MGTQNLPSALVRHADPARVPDPPRPEDKVRDGTGFAPKLVMKTIAVRRILVAVDLSSCSRAALEFAYSLGSALGASLEVLFVHQPNDGAAFGAKEAKATRQELHRFVEAAEFDASVPVNERVESGDARDQIVKIAESDGFDLIVLGTHGRTGRPHSLAGSVAESVVRTASRPVLTVREK